jgi:ferredoxin
MALVRPVPSPFDVLGVDPHADEETVERAYKRRVKESHPDHGGSAEEFQAVRAAYEEIITGEVDRYGEAERAEAERDDGPTGGRWRDERESRDTGSDEARVEYLDYECLDDHGWSLDDADLFEKAADADLEDADYGGFLVRADETLLEAAEKRGFAWPYACRGGACANCAVAVTEGELSTPVDHILPEEMVARGIRLSCVGRPTTEELRVVYNIKHLPDLDDLRLPPRPFEQAQAD